MYPELSYAPTHSVELPGRGTSTVRFAGGSVPVLLLHGWMLTADVNFCHVMTPLAERFGVVAMDLRGHGRGLPLPRGERFSIAQCADDAAALLDVLDVERVVVCGYSLGGPIGLEFTRRYRDRVAGLVFQATASSFDTASDKIARVVLQAMRPMATRSRGFGRSAPMHYLRLKRGRDPATEALWPALRDQLRQCHPRVMVDAILAEYALDLAPALPAMADLPSTVVVTARDRLVSPEDQRSLARRLAAGTIEIDCGHEVFLTDPAAYTAATVTAVERVLSA